MAKASVHRALRRGNRGPDVKALQKEVNFTLGNRGFPWRKVRVDGKVGPQTLKAIHMAAWLQGFSRDALRKIHHGHVNQHAQQLLRHSRKRSKAMQKRERQRRPAAKKLRQLHRKVPSRGVTTFDGNPVAAWMVPYLRWARDHGWDGVLVSGYRDPEYSEGLCFAMCGAPSCPGRCAGRSSNHSGSVKPAGALDVSDYYTFGRLMQSCPQSPRIFNGLGSRDPVHFSASGN